MGKEEVFQGELDSAMAGGLAAAKHKYTGSSASILDAALFVRFYDKPHLNEEMTKRGFHWVNEDNEPVAFKKGMDTTHLKRVLCTCINEERGEFSEVVKRANIRDGYHVQSKAPVWEDKVWVQIRQAGQLDYLDTFAWLDFSHNPPAGAHNVRFQKQYEHYLSKAEGGLLLGEPIENLAKTTPRILTLAQVEDMKHLNIRTIQALVAMPAPESTGIMGINNIIAKAKAHLAQVEEAFPVDMMKGELKKRDDLIQGQAMQLAELTKQLNALGLKPELKRGRGRPKKVVEAEETQAEAG
jgi:hypothetical protein